MPDTANTTIEQTYRPHNPGHDYYAPGIYLITLVVRDRENNHTMFGHLNDNIKDAGVVLNDVGKAVMEEWLKIPAFEATKGHDIALHGACCMPDHFHGVLEVRKAMDRSVGQIIWGFKVACTKRWHGLLAANSDAAQPMTAVRPSLEPMTAVRPSLEPVTAVRPSLVALQERLHHMSKAQRSEYYRLHPEALHPLWDDNYDDTICLRENDDTICLRENEDSKKDGMVTSAYSKRHFEAMVRYVRDNPRRAIIRHLRPEYMRRCLHVVIDGRDYAAFGNLFLLRWARKVQVFCHRRDPVSHVPYEMTEAYREQCREWKRLVMEGATVIVTPGISAGERIIKDRCLESHYPLIHLQKEAIGRYWKPEAKRFDACSRGSLLILAPWKAEEMGDVAGVPSNTDYSIFHNLNRLAEDICRFDGEACVCSFPTLLTPGR